MNPTEKKLYEEDSEVIKAVGGWFMKVTLWVVGVAIVGWLILWLRG